MVDHVYKSRVTRHKELSEQSKCENTSKSDTLDFSIIYIFIVGLLALLSLSHYANLRQIHVPIHIN